MLYHPPCPRQTLEYFHGFADTHQNQAASEKECYWHTRGNTEGCGLIESQISNSTNYFNGIPPTSHGERLPKVGEDDYICEAALWLKWEHGGRLSARGRALGPALRKRVCCRV